MIPLKDDNPTSTRPFVTVGLIAANIAVFLYQFSLLPEAQDAFVSTYGSVPYGVLHAGGLESYRGLLTHMFLHGGLLHLGGNMLYLWIFGNNIEDSLGHVRFIFFYVACGLVAAGSHMLLNPYSLVPMVGASGAISGVMGAYLYLFPRARIVTLFFFFFFVRIIRIPAFFLLGVWILLQAVNAGQPAHAGGGGVAWFAHIGGFLAGFVLILISGRKKKRRKPVRVIDWE